MPILTGSIIAPTVGKAKNNTEYIAGSQTQAIAKNSYTS